MHVKYFTALPVLLAIGLAAVCPSEAATVCASVNAQQTCDTTPAGLDQRILNAKDFYNAKHNLQLTNSEFALEMLKRGLRSLAVNDKIHAENLQALKDAVNTEQAGWMTDFPEYVASCGDSRVESSEQCDNGGANADTAPCTTGCQIAACGDTLVCSDLACTSGPGAGVEQCDDGQETVACNTNCSTASCGDNIVNAARGEVCDGTSADDCPTGTCTGSCFCPDPICGNNVKEDGEQCDGTDSLACPGICDPSGPDACTCP